MVKYIVNLIKSLKEIVIVYLLQFVLLLVLFLLQVDYNTLYLVVIIFNLFIVVYLWKKKEILTKINNNLFPLISLGVSIALFFNMIIFLGKESIVDSSVNLVLVIISTAIIGPILEEILFRKCLIDNLLKFNNKYIAVVLSSGIFALIHGQLITILYTFILGIVLGIVYLKYQDIKASMIVHIVANFIVIFINEFNIYVLMLSFVSLIISILMIKKDKTLQLN